MKLKPGEDRRVIKTRWMKAGYEIRHEYVATYFADRPVGHCLLLKHAYSPSGAWVGSIKYAYYLVVKLGIVPISVNDKNICTIGYCSKDGKWYGWSHKAICGFGKGDMLFVPGDWPEDKPFRECGFERIVHMEQAQKAAINFAEDVS